MTGNESLSGAYTAVVDRIVDGETAVLLVEDDGAVVDQLDVAVDRLPDQARADGAVLHVELDEGAMVECEYQADETTTRQQSIKDRYESLSRKLSDE